MECSKRWVVCLLMLWLVGTAHASLTCFNKSKKPLKLKGTGLIEANVDIKANAKATLQLLPLVTSLLCSITNVATGGASIVLNLLTTPYIACVDVDTKVTLYACDKLGNIKGKPLCDPF